MTQANKAKRRKPSGDAGAVTDEPCSIWRRLWPLSCQEKNIQNLRIIVNQSTKVSDRGVIVHAPRTQKQIVGRIGDGAMSGRTQQMI